MQLSAVPWLVALGQVPRMSRKGNAKTVATFDFSTLYTKIPHDKLIEVLNTIIDSTFNKTNRKYLSVTKSGAHWVTGKKHVNKIYDADKVKAIIKYLVVNSYFTVGSLLFRQIIGIPMGSDPAPFFANLFLYFYEVQWIKTLKKSDYSRARRFLNTFRFIDDLITLNDAGEFSRSCLEIYPPELVLKKENETDSRATFLDMEINIIDNKYIYNLYDKRDSYPFFIVRFPYKCSNIPSKIFHSTIGAETLRICRASSTLPAFLKSTKPFYSRMVNQGARDNSIKHVLNKFFNRHKQDFSKFEYNLQDIMKSLDL